jgi:hypothetical protein
MLTWGRGPFRDGNGWTLTYLEEQNSPTSGADNHFIPGDLTDVDYAVKQAEDWLRRIGYSPAEDDE